MAYHDEPPHKVVAVYFSQKQVKERPIDLTSQVLCSGPFTGLARIYEKVTHLAKSDSPGGQPENLAETEDEFESQEKYSEGEAEVYDREDIKGREKNPNWEVL